MGKLDPYMQGRQEGMSYALKIAREKGVEGLEKEIRYRNIEGAWNTKISLKELKDAKNRITDRTIGIITCSALLALRDEFDFGRKRGEQFLDRFYEKINCLLGDPENGWGVTLEEYMQAVYDEMGIIVNISEGLN